MTSAMTSAPAASPPPRLHWFADLFLALFLLAVDAGLLFVIWFGAAMYAWRKGGSGDDFAAAADAAADATVGGLIAVGVLAVLTAVASYRLFRTRRPIAAVAQAVAAAVLVFGALAGAALEYHERHRKTVSPAEHRGPVGCRSGGDSGECRDSGG
ncbi:DUF6234 family protein [Streptomyces niger]|uniref:DUF6234 family protein n=1 Tax=Streptomyces niger TaxID=66373 RepID=UPI000699D265|nr:DUF6234 family protein [Streptomyces niger]